MATITHEDLPKSKHCVAEVKTGTVMNLRCTVCDEQLPITKPLGITTIVAVMNGFGSVHLHPESA